MDGSTPTLRERLITAGLELLRDEGMAGLTLRRAAARAGVSHAAPAHHFDGLPGLLTAIAARAFSEFAAEMEGARDESPSTDFDRLHGICLGYLRFAQYRGGLFQLMFATPGLDRADADLHCASSRAYGILRDGCAPFADPDFPEKTELGVWSLVHGFAQLGLSDKPAADRAFSRVPAFRDLLARQIGLA